MRQMIPIPFRRPADGAVGGIRLNMMKPQWELAGRTTFPDLLRALAGVLPERSVLYFEDGSPSGDLKAFLDRTAMDDGPNVSPGTLWPEPRVDRIPATAANLDQLADLAEHCAEPELAIHFYVYRDREVLMQWHDAFSDPMFVSKQGFSEEAVRTLCGELSMTYSEYRPGVEHQSPADR